MRKSRQIKARFLASSVGHFDRGAIHGIIVELIKRLYLKVREGEVRETWMVSMTDTANTKKLAYLHCLSKFLNILLTLHCSEILNMAQLMFTHGMPSCNSFMASNGAGIALASGTDVVLKGEIFSNHAGTIPDKLINFEGRGCYTLWKAWIGALSIPLLCRF
jgi:hypothetical protein